MPATAKRVEEGLQRQTEAAETIISQLRSLDKLFMDLEHAPQGTTEKDDLLDYALALVRKSFGAFAGAMAMGEGEQRESALKALEEQYDGDYY